MGRDIKSRAWHKIHKAMYRYVEHVSYPDGSSGIGFIGPFSPNNDDVELMQYTGLKDSKGTEIFEGDILDSLGVIEFKNGSFVVNGWEPIGEMSVEKSVIIGNRYEHGHLLEREQDNKE